MSDLFSFDVFLSHSSKDKSIVRSIAERLRADGLRVWFDESEIRPGDSIPAKIEEGLERSRVLVLCMSAQAFGSDWAQLEAGTFRFRDPLNKERRFIPIRLDDAPIKGSLAQFLYINWHPEDRVDAYRKLLEACRPPAKWGAKAGSEQLAEKIVQLDCGEVPIQAYAFSNDGKRVLTGDKSLRLWDGETGLCLRSLKSHKGFVRFIEWSDDQRRALVGTDDDRVRLLDVEADRLIVDYGKSKLSKRQMDSFRLLAGGLSASNIQLSLGLSSITTNAHLQQLRLNLGVPRRNDVREMATRLYGGSRRTTFPPLRAHPIWVPHLAWAIERSIALSRRGKGGADSRFRLCSKYGGRPPRRSGEPGPDSWSCVWSADQRSVIYGGKDGVLWLWNAMEAKRERAFEGHTGPILSVALNTDQRSVLSGSADQTVRLWDIQSGRSIRVLTGHIAEIVRVAWFSDRYRAFSGDRKGRILVWDFSKIMSGTGVAEVTSANFDVLIETAMAEAPRQVQYTNAKVLLVGDSGVGKSGLSNYLAHGIKVEEDKPLASTDGAWATHWPLYHTKTATSGEREIWLWDFAGQVDYRLVHQLFMDDTAAAVLVFNPQNENPFEGLGRWDLDLQKAARKPFAKLLAAGRTDCGGLLVSATSVKRFMNERGFLSPLHLTSAKTGEGCDQLRDAIVGAIDWKSIPKTTSPELYQRMKQEILALRDSGLVLIRLAELKQRMEMTLGGEDFELSELEKVIGLLAGPGMIQKLDFGGFILLRPEVLSRYAAALVRKVRKHPQEMGCIREDELLAGDLDYQDFKRLASEDETVVLRTLLETFVGRAWCLRQPCDGTAVLTFPSYFRRERKEQPSHPSVLVTYRFDGPTDDIYATLVVRLHHTLAFEATNLWKSAADFKTQTKANLGFTLAREAEGTSRLEVYFEPDVDLNSRLLFLRYVHDHLTQHARKVERVRHYSCLNKKCRRFNQGFLDRQIIDEALSPVGDAKVFCHGCGKPIVLRDTIEEKFDSPEVKEHARELDAEAQVIIDNESRELMAVHHTGFIVSEAGQIYRGYTNSDHGIDGEIEFKDDHGRASGRRLYMQLKSGDSYLKKRRRDGAEVFQIKNPRWADYWQQQSYAVMLVIRTSGGEIRWMDVSAYLKRETVSGKKVKQIVFTGERFDVMSVRRWRNRLLIGSSS